MTRQSANGMKISNKYLRLTSHEGLKGQGTWTKKIKIKSKEKVQRESWAEKTKKKKKEEGRRKKEEGRRRRRRRRRRGGEEGEQRKLTCTWLHVSDWFFIFIFIFSYLFIPAESSILAEIGWNDQNLLKWVEIFSEVEERGFSF